MPRLVIALTLAAGLAAADPLPAAFIPAQADLAVQVPDLARSRQRWSRTPYPHLLQSGWGRTLVGEWGGRLERLAPGAGDALAGLRSLAIGVIGSPDAAPQGVVAVAGGPALPATLAAIWNAGLPGQVAGGRISTYGAVVAWASGAGGAVLPGQQPPPPSAEADAAIRLVPGRWLPGSEGELRVELQLDAVGLRETATATATAATRLAAVTPRTWADPQELRRLPATTLWAATWRGDAALATQLPGGDAAGQVLIERWLTDQGLPGWRETLAAAEGPATVWMAEGVPFPSLGLAITMQEAVARRWIAAAAAKLNLAATPDGAAGFVGLLPVAVGWIPEGRLVITSDPQGVGVWASAKPGFADHRGVAEVLSAVPPRTLLIGAGRGGASWGAIAQLTVPVFAAMGSPQSVSLPGDLRVAADRGWVYLRLLEDGTVQSEAGGLFGGPFTIATAAGIAVPATIWLQGELQREQQERRRLEQRQRLQAPGPEAGKTPPVF